MHKRRTPHDRDAKNLLSSVSFSLDTLMDSTITGHGIRKWRFYLTINFSIPSGNRSKTSFVLSNFLENNKKNREQKKMF